MRTDQLTVAESVAVIIEYLNAEKVQPVEAAPPLPDSWVAEGI